MSQEENTRLKITDTGITIPDIKDIYNSVIGEWKDAFGGDLRTDNALSPQGQICRSIAEQIDAKNKELLFLTNQFNINEAQGNFLDKIYNNFGIYRDKGTKSIVTCDCVLKPETIINIGDQIQNENGDIFESTEQYTAVVGEKEYDIIFEAEKAGAIECGANTVDTIVTTKEGWISVNNKEPGTTGTEETKTKVTCQCKLKPGATIEIGDRVKDSSKNIYLSTQTFTAPEEVIQPIIFASQEIGAIECKANTLNQIITRKEGWESVNNSGDGIIGYSEENDAQFRVRARDSLYINAVGTQNALYSNLININGVSQVYIRQNRTKEIITIDGVAIKPNSVYICLKYDGQEETRNKIAKTIQLIAGATSLIGDTQVELLIENSPNNQTEYINFQTAIGQHIYLKVIIRQLVNFSETTANKIKEIILDNFNGNVENIKACSIGEIIEANRFFENLVYLQGTNEAVISEIKVSLDNNNWQNNLSVPITHYPIMEEDNINVIQMTE